MNVWLTAMFLFFFLNHVLYSTESVSEVDAFLIVYHYIFLYLSNVYIISKTIQKYNGVAALGFEKCLKIVSLLHITSSILFFFCFNALSLKFVQSLLINKFVNVFKCLRLQFCFFFLYNLSKYKRKVCVYERNVK